MNFFYSENLRNHSLSKENEFYFWFEITLLFEKPYANFIEIRLFI
jgi:hypothetical protein